MHQNPAPILSAVQDDSGRCLKYVAKRGEKVTGNLLEGKRTERMGHSQFVNVVMLSDS